MTDRNEAIIKYRLYALNVTTENAVRAAEERFCRINPGYILVYTKEEPKYRAMEIAGNDIKKLSAMDKKWLLDCNMAIIAEETVKREPEIAAQISKQLEDLERELEKERAKQKEGVNALAQS